MKGTHKDMFTYIYSILIEKDICDRRNVSVKLPYVCVLFIRRSLHFFSIIFLFLYLSLHKCIFVADSEPAPSTTNTHIAEPVVAAN